MLCYADRTFCNSPHCTNECGRKLPKELENEAKNSQLFIAYANFCGESKKVESTQLKSKK